MGDWTVIADHDRAPRIEFDEDAKLLPGDISLAVAELSDRLDAIGVTERPIEFWIGQKGVFGKTMRLNSRPATERGEGE